MMHLLEKKWICRVASIDDAKMMANIYNETLSIGGHSPQLTLATEIELCRMINLYKSKGWPIWIVIYNNFIAGWLNIKPISWGYDTCHQTGDVSIYIHHKRYGSRAAILLSLIAYDNALRYGFNVLTCWIMSSNLASLALAKGFGMKQWGELPGIINFGGITSDLHIFGGRFDDTLWCEHMDNLHQKMSRLRDINSLKI